MIRFALVCLLTGDEMPTPRIYSNIHKSNFYKLSSFKNLAKSVEEDRTLKKSEESFRNKAYPIENTNYDALLVRELADFFINACKAKANHKNLRKIFEKDFSVGPQRRISFDLLGSDLILCEGQNRHKLFDLQKFLRAPKKIKKQMLFNSVVNYLYEFTPTESPNAFIKRDGTRFYIGAEGQRETFAMDGLYHKLVARAFVSSNFEPIEIKEEFKHNKVIKQEIGDVQRFYDDDGNLRREVAGDQAEKIFLDKTIHQTLPNQYKRTYNREFGNILAYEVTQTDIERTYDAVSLEETGYVTDAPKISALSREEVLIGGLPLIRRDYTLQEDEQGTLRPILTCMTLITDQEGIRIEYRGLTEISSNHLEFPCTITLKQYDSEASGLNVGYESFQRADLESEEESSLVTTHSYDDKFKIEVYEDLSVMVLDDEGQLLCHIDSNGQLKKYDSDGDLCTVSTASGQNFEVLEMDDGKRDLATVINWTGNLIEYSEEQRIEYSASFDSKYAQYHDLPNIPKAVLGPDHALVLSNDRGQDIFKRDRSGKDLMMPFAPDLDSVIEAASYAYVKASMAKNEKLNLKMKKKFEEAASATIDVLKRKLEPTGDSLPNNSNRVHQLFVEHILNPPTKEVIGLRELIQGREQDKEQDQLAKKSLAKILKAIDSKA